MRGQQECTNHSFRSSHINSSHACGYLPNSDRERKKLALGRASEVAGGGGLGAVGDFIGT